METRADKFVLKLYDTSTATAQIQYEHSLLAHLRSYNLSFALPTPVPTASGETLVVVNQNDSALRVALLPFISGQPAERQNLNHLQAAGQALGELHSALTSFDPKGQLAQLPTWGDLKHIHPLVTNPLEVPRALELESIQQKRFVKTLIEVLETAPNLYRTLPVQTTHADYLCPNVLVRDNQVVGILDFEFATSDLRLLDYVAALDHFTRPSKDVPLWERIQAFSMGYAKHVSLSHSELEALPLAWRLQQASCLVYWTGWLRQEKATYKSVVDGVMGMLLLEDWLEENTVSLLSKLAAIFE